MTVRLATAVVVEEEPLQSWWVTAAASKAFQAPTRKPESLASQAGSTVRQQQQRDTEEIASMAG